MKHFLAALSISLLASLALAGEHRQHQKRQDNDDNDSVVTQVVTVDAYDTVVTQVATAFETDWVYQTVWVDGPEAEATPAPVTADSGAQDAGEAYAPNTALLGSYEEAQPSPGNGIGMNGYWGHSVATYTSAPQPTTFITAVSAPASSAPSATPAPSQAPAPAVAPAPSPDPAPAPAPAQSSAPVASAAAQSPASGGSSGEQYTGKATFYDVGLGSCGETNVPSDMIVAIAPQFMKASCGKTIKISAGGKTATAKVMDTCPSCDAGHLDMSRGLFGQLTDNNFDLGVLQGLTWSFAS